MSGKPPGKPRRMSNIMGNKGERPFHDSKVWGARSNDLKKNSCSTYRFWSVGITSVCSSLEDYVIS
jgi:hypothetical protein